MVLDVDGLALSDVRVLVRGEEVARTDAQGRFETALASGRDHVLTFDSADHVRDHKPVLFSDGESEGADLAVVMTRRGSLLVLSDAAAGGTLTGPLGGRVTFPEGAIVDASGVPVQGAVALWMTPVDFTRPLGRDSFPGSADALDDAGEPVQLESFGVMDVTFVEEGVRLADGVMATLEIPLTAGTLRSGDTTPLWFLDEASGLWQQQGEGTVVRRGGRDYLRGEVPHFSWWNCDIGVAGERLLLELLDHNGEPYTGLFNIRLDFDAASGVFTPFLPSLRANPAPRLLLPTEREVVLSVFTIETGQFGTATKTIAPGRTDPVRVMLEPPDSEDILLPRDEAVEIEMDEGEVVYLAVALEEDEVRFVNLEALEGLEASANQSDRLRFGRVQRVDSATPQVAVAFTDTPRTVRLRVQARSAGTLRAQDGSPELAVDEIRRVSLEDNQPSELTVFLRAGQWVRLAARGADPENTVAPFLSLQGRTAGDGSESLSEEIIRIGRTGTYTFRANVTRANAGDYDIVVRSLNAPEAVAFSPETLGRKGTLDLPMGGGRLFAVPIAEDGAAEAWVRATDGVSGVTAINRRWQGDSQISLGLAIRNAVPGTLEPIPDRGFAGRMTLQSWNNDHLLVFLGVEDRWNPAPTTEVEYVVATFRGEIDALVVGDPEVDGCEPNAHSPLAGALQLTGEGQITFCEGDHNLRDGRIDLDNLDLRGQGVDRTRLHLWRGEAIHDGRPTFALAPSQHWRFRDFELNAWNSRIGNEGAPAIDFQSNTDPSTFDAARVRIHDRRAESTEGAEWGGAGINIGNRTANRLVATITDSEFIGMDTAIRPFSGARVTLEGNTISASRRGIVASDVIELIARDNLVEVRDEGIVHSGTLANRSVIEDNLIVRENSGTTASCIGATSRETELDVPLSDPLTLVRYNTCLNGEGHSGLWLSASGRGGALIEGNRVGPMDGTDAIGGVGLRINWSAPNVAIVDNPGPIHVVNNVFEAHRSTGGVIGVSDAHNFGTIEIVNNTINLVAGSGNGRSRGIDISYRNDTEGVLPIIVVNNLINGAAQARDQGVVLSNDQVTITSVGNWFANLQAGHARSGTSDALPGYADNNGFGEARITLDGEGRPLPGSASIDQGVVRDEVPDEDIDGVQRPQGAGIDPGAHEQ